MFKYLLIGALFLQSTLICYSYKKPNEKCQLRKVTGDTFSSIYNYDAENRLITLTSIYNDTNLLNKTQTQYEYDTIGRLSLSQVTYGSKADHPNYQYTYHYDKSNQLTFIKEARWLGDTWSELYTYRVAIENGRVVGFDQYVDAIHLKGNRWLDFRDGNFHRFESYTLNQGKKQVVSITDYEYDKRSNPYLNQPNSLPHMSQYNRNNVISVRTFENNELISSSSIKGMYRKGLLVSATTLFNDSTENTMTYEYDCF